MQYVSCLRSLAVTCCVLALALFFPGICQAQDDTAAARVQIGTWADTGDLDTEHYILVNGFQTTGLTIYGYDGTSHSDSGTSSAKLTNNTGSSVTIQNPSPTIKIKANGSTRRNTGAAANSSISLGTETASGSCSGTAGTYSQEKTATFTVSNLANGANVSQSGSWSALVNGG